jgi:hypothetical protein
VPAARTNNRMISAAEIGFVHGRLIRGNGSADNIRAGGSNSPRKRPKT